jgi:hypothetical protein
MMACSKSRGIIKQAHACMHASIHQHHAWTHIQHHHHHHAWTHPASPSTPRMHACMHVDDGGHHKVWRLACTCMASSVVCTHMHATHDSLQCNACIHTCHAMHAYTHAMQCMHTPMQCNACILHTCNAMQCMQTTHMQCNACMHGYM